MRWTSSVGAPGSSAHMLPAIVRLSRSSNLLPSGTQNPRTRSSSGAIREKAVVATMSAITTIDWATAQSLKNSGTAVGWKLMPMKISVTTSVIRLICIRRVPTRISSAATRRAKASS